jgi:hypothetical protein
MTNPQKLINLLAPDPKGWQIDFFCSPWGRGKQKKSIGSMKSINVISNEIIPELAKE